MDKNKWLRVGVGILVLFLVGVFLKLARPILVPFALALLFSFAVSPGLDFLVRRKAPKAVALIIILILSFASLYLMGTVFYSGGKSLAAELPSYTEMVRGFLAKIDSLVPDPRLKVGLTEWIQGFNIGSAGTFLLSTLGPFFSFMSDLLLVFVFMTFILAGRGRMAKKFDEAFPPGQASALSRTAVRIDCEIQKYLAVKTLTNLLIGILAASVLALFGVRFALVFGVLAVLFNYVPTLGAVVSVALPVSPDAVPRRRPDPQGPVRPRPPRRDPRGAAQGRRAPAHGQGAQPVAAPRPLFADLLGLAVGHPGHDPGGPDPDGGPHPLRERPLAAISGDDDGPVRGGEDGAQASRPTAARNCSSRRSILSAVSL